MKKGFARTGSWIDVDFDDDFDDNFSNSSPPASMLATKSNSNSNSNLDSNRKRKNDFYETSTVSISEKKSNRIALEDDVQLWIERHQPKTVSDLAVHPKKIEEIKFWFENNVVGNRNRAVKGKPKQDILLLTGPPGCGKTATVKALAISLRVTIQEWINPTESAEFVARSDNPVGYFNPSDDIPYVSQTNSFKTFMLRANRYKVLSGLLENNSDSDQNEFGSKIVLIEELPSFALRKKEDFQEILFQYHRSTRSFPLVIIQSESQNEDTIKKLFPPEFITQLSIHQIQMNAVAPTNMVKALSAIANSESMHGVRKFSVPDKTALTSLAVSSSGDIRSAINALQFACLNDVRGDMRNAFEGTTSLAPSSKKKKQPTGGASKNSKSKTSDHGSTLASIGGKDPSLDLFHAMGKVLYCKREDTDLITDVKLLPRHLSDKARKKLIINPEELLDNVSMSEASFVAFLHQNYVDFFGNISSLSDAAEYLSLSEPFFDEWTTSGKIFLSDYGGSLAIRGLCHSNTRSTQMSGMKNFHKPEWFATNKTAQNRRSYLSNLFQARGLSHVELSTVFLPHLAKCYGSSLPKEASEIGVFPGFVQLKNQESNTKQFLLANELEKVDEVNEEDDEADYLIEELD